MGLVTQPRVFWAVGDRVITKAENRVAYIQRVGVELLVLTFMEGGTVMRAPDEMVRWPVGVPRPMMLVRRNGRLLGDPT